MILVRDIRKQYSQSMQELDKVRDLEEKKQLHLLACQVGKLETDLNQAGLEQIVSLHKGLKEANPDVVLCHVLDRWFDDVDYFQTLEAVLKSADSKV